MIDLDLWFPEDFDKKYAKYLEKNNDSKIPEPFFAERLENERKHLLTVTNEKDFQHEIDKWQPLKVIIDAIYKELSPFLPGEAQIIKIDPTKLDLEEKQVSHILMMLAYERICRWKISKSTAVISNEALIEYLRGNGIVIPDYEQFREFRNKVNDFSDFMDRTKADKFPKPDRPTLNIVTEMKKEAEETIKKHLPEYQKTIEAFSTALKASAPTPFMPLTSFSSPSLHIPALVDESADGLPLIEYNTESGRGRANNKKFKFKDGNPEYHIFKQLYLRMGKKLERQDVLIAGGFYQDHEAPDPARVTDETGFINDIAKTIREKTGFNTEQMVNNGGNLTLVAEKKVQPKKTKTTPNSPK